MLRGDLQAIVAKALRKEPQSRYRTVAEFGDDLRRYLDGEPVLAVEGARTYRLRKFVAQHRLPVGLAAVAFLCLLTALIGMTWLGYKLRLQAERADQQSRTAVATRDFLLDLFKAASPERTLGKVPDAVELVDIGARRAENWLDAPPELQAQLLGTLGNVYVNLGEYDTALTILDKARGIAMKTYGSDAVSTMQLDLDIANAIYLNRTNSDQARTLLERIIAAQRRLPPEQRTLLVRALRALGSLEYRSDRDEQAEALLREALGLARAQGETRPRELVATLAALAGVMEKHGQLVNAEMYVREALTIATSILPWDDPERALLQGQLADDLSVMGKVAEAESLLRDNVERQKRVVGETHPQYIAQLGALGRVLLLEQKLEEAERVLMRALVLGERADKQSHVFAYNLQLLANLKNLQSEPQDALPYAEHAHAIFVAKYGEDNAYAFSAAVSLIDVQLDYGAYAQAETEARNILVRAENLNIPAVIPLASIRLGQALRRVGRPTEAIPFLRRAINDLNASKGERNFTSLAAILELSKAERDAGHHDLAREQAKTVLGFAPSSLPTDDSRVLQAHAVLAQLDYLQQRCNESALDDLEALKKQLERKTPNARVEITGTALMAGLCRRQVQGHPIAASQDDSSIRTYAHEILQTPTADPFYRKLAARELGAN